MTCIFDKVDSFLIRKTSLYNVDNKTELQCHIRDTAEYVSDIYNKEDPVIKHLLTDICLLTAALIGTEAGIPIEYTLSAAGLVALSDIAYHAITAGGNESFAGNGVPVNSP